MAKQTSGYVFEEGGRWYARFTYTDQTGKRRNVKRRAESKSQAREILKQLIDEFEQHGSHALDVARMTFNDLADFYAENYLRPAEFVEGRKVTGLRDWKHPKAYLSIFRERFGRRLLREITHEDIRAFRSERLRTTTQRRRQRSITTVNRELACLRRIFNVAHRNGWILKNPFATGDILICLAAERKRERILTRDEEVRLLATCTGRRKHLRAIIICALDTGMRLGEILSLRWEDVDLKNRLLTIRAHNTKTERERQVSLTTRLFTELELLNARAAGSNELVFGFKSNVRTSFQNVRAAAGLPDIRFHDLRHTAATRLVIGHLPLSEVGRILGHTQPSTTYRYVNANVETARRAAAVLDTYQTVTVEPEVVEVVSEMVN